MSVVGFGTICGFTWTPLGTGIPRVKETFVVSTTLLRPSSPMYPPRS